MRYELDWENNVWGFCIEEQRFVNKQGTRGMQGNWRKRSLELLKDQYGNPFSQSTFTEFCENLLEGAITRYRESSGSETEKELLDLSVFLDEPTILLLVNDRTSTPSDLARKLLN
jgi:hypothetical protein